MGCQVLAQALTSGISETTVAPTVTTGAASAITDSTAQLNGTITATGGENVTRRFDWGTTSNNYTSTWIDTGTYGVGAYSHSIVVNPNTRYYAMASANNTGGTGNGTEITFLTLPAQPTGLIASDGTSTANITLTWNPLVCDNITIWRNGANVTSIAGNLTTWTDTTADAPTIDAGGCTASDGTSETFVLLNLTGVTFNNGTTYTYKIQAYNSSGLSANSTEDTGYRGHGVAGIQWQKTSLDNVLDTYNNIVGATTDAYQDTSGNVTPSKVWYRALLSATGATSNTTVPDSGNMAAPSTTSNTFFKGFILIVMVVVSAMLLMLYIYSVISWKIFMFGAIGIVLCYYVVSYLVNTLF
ncbi:hypothetical protein M0R04_08235 [Candidatus Dojkabacteria bacterium]|nr:hypothetical protein [Candidatus Dojkabacteria bacterium]